MIVDVIAHIEHASAQECSALLTAIASRLAVIPPSPPAVRDDPEEALSVDEVATLLKVSRRSVQRLAHRPPLRIAVITSLGRQLLFSRRKVERLIAREAGNEPFTLGLRGVNSGRRPQRKGSPRPAQSLTAVPGPTGEGKSGA